MTEWFNTLLPEGVPGAVLAIAVILLGLGTFLDSFFGVKVKEGKEWLARVVGFALLVVGVWMTWARFGPTMAFEHSFDEAGDYEWTVPEGVRSVLAIACGAGGEGGGGPDVSDAASGGGGGGAGAVPDSLRLDVRPGAILRLRVGEGGAGGRRGDRDEGQTPVDGLPGSETTVAGTTFVGASGGEAGSRASGGVGGAGDTLRFTVGGDGGFRSRGSAGSASAYAGAGRGGLNDGWSGGGGGGGAGYGEGGDGGNGERAKNGLAGARCGGGGGGGGNANQGPGGTGGRGGDGFVRLVWVAPVQSDDQ